MLKQKLHKIQTELRQQQLDALLIGNFGHQIADDLLYYLLLKKLECATMYIPARGKPTLWGISFEVAQLQRAYPEITVKTFDKKVGELLPSPLGRGKGTLMGEDKVIGIRSNVLPHSVYKELRNYRIKEFQNSHQITAIKFPEEIKILQKAADITNDVFELALLNWRKFKTELDAANFINHSFVALGFEPSFPTIVASGKNAAHPHHVPTDTKIQHGFCVIDMGVRFQGYCSDMTRTIFIGQPTTDDRRLYETLLQSQEKTISMVTPGVMGKQLDKYCRDLLGKKLSKEFIHGLGHGVGTQVHEWPAVNAKSEAVLQENMVITIEPGIYKNNAYGIRIEDDILVKKDKPVILTTTSKELRVIK
jgi:Xaa-Pro aminopeptidase